MIGEKTESMALLIQRSIGPNVSSTRAAAASTASASATSSGSTSASPPDSSISRFGFETLDATRDQPDPGAALSEQPRRRAPDAGGGAGDDHHFLFVLHEDSLCTFCALVSGG